MSLSDTEEDSKAKFSPDIRHICAVDGQGELECRMKSVLLMKVRIAYTVVLGLFIGSALWDTGRDT